MNMTLRSITRISVPTAALIRSHRLTSSVVIAGIAASLLLVGVHASTSRVDPLASTKGSSETTGTQTTSKQPTSNRQAGNDNDAQAENNATTAVANDTALSPTPASKPVVKPPAPAPAKTVPKPTPAPTPPTMSPNALKYSVDTSNIVVTAIEYPIRARMPYTLTRDGTYNGPDGPGCGVASGPGKRSDVFCSAYPNGNGGGEVEIIVNYTAPNGTYNLLIGTDIGYTSFKNSFTININGKSITN